MSARIEILKTRPETPIAEMEMATEHFDVVIMGAGLSGIDAAWHLQKNAPGKKYVILENRDRIGGTWDLFRYPGIRSDSDMLTMGYSFRPWTHPSAISPGNAIRDYISDTARDAGIDRNIRFRHKVLGAAWSSQTGRWTVDAVRRDAQGREEPVQFTTGFLFSCAGYYRYDQGFTPEFAGRDRFKGTIIHPQHWPENFDYTGKRIVIIGSGATAVTLVPSMAKTAAHVTMLQRSPTYFVSRPEKDKVANFLRTVLPATWAYAIPRWRNIILQRFFFGRSRKNPQQVKNLLINGVKQLLGPDYDVAKHFTPRYNPWDERLCLVPDADLFKSIRSGQAEVVTDHIDTFTETGIKLKSGKELQADVIVTATGLQLEILGGIGVSVDGEKVDFSKTFTYKGLMFSGVPNLASVFGYTNASWTLRADLVCEYVCRLLNHMDATGTRIATPRLREQGLQATPWLDFTSGYVQRALSKLPKQGPSAPWRQNQDYFADIKDMRRAPIDDGVLEFTKPATAADAGSSKSVKEAAE
jgi:cation diffusion facilitator CzcD-associated flavoprotein CzcO